MLKVLFLSLFIHYTIPAAAAHPLDLALLKLTDSGNSPGNSDNVQHLHARLEVNPGIAARLLAVDLGSLERSLESRSAEYFKLTLGGSHVDLGGPTCTWTQTQSAKIENPQLLSIEADGQCTGQAAPKGEFTLTLPFLAQMAPTYRLMYMATLNGHEHVGDATPLRAQISFGLGEASLTFSRFIEMGLQHIGMTPGEWYDARGLHLPAGIDHILFVLALLFSGASFVNLLRTVTGFTLGHTLSLALASFGVIQVSGRWIEAAIALTIAGVALDSVLRPGGRAQHRWKVTIGIGIIHGLGFAAALANLKLDISGLIRSILGFNLGVEIGQAIVVGVAMPFLFALKKWPRIESTFLRATSALIFVIASYWFIRRALV